MSYKSILVHMNDEHRAPALLQAGLNLAHMSSGHLVGLSVMPPVIIVPDTEGSSGTVIEDHRDSYRPQVAHMRKMFNEACAAANVRGEWRELDCQAENPFGDVAQVAIDQARGEDLVIASQANPAWKLTGYLDVAEPLILESGRPVLLMPRAARHGDLPKRILVAWNSSREATRAVFDAMPLLQAADQVLVGSVDQQQDNKRKMPLADICRALARQGVTCEALPPIKPEGGVGRTLLHTATAKQADMLVMGCYGHSRLREFLLGGATRYVMEHTQIPVLMSH